MVIANVLEKAGVYRMVVEDSNRSAVADKADSNSKSQSVPIAVTPDLRETEDLSSLSDAEIDRLLGFIPVHITAGPEAARSGSADRLNREWTMWLLTGVLILALGESLLAYWCGKAW